jgi:hypothetical protein
MKRQSFRIETLQAQFGRNTKQQEHQYLRTRYTNRAPLKTPGRRSGGMGCEKQHVTH